MNRYLVYLKKQKPVKEQFGRKKARNRNVFNKEGSQELKSIKIA